MSGVASGMTIGLTLFACLMFLLVFRIHVGIGMFFAYQVAPYLASGALRVILADFETPPRPIHVVYPEARLLPARTRVFIEAIKRHILAEQSAWQPSEPSARRARAGRTRR